MFVMVHADMLELFLPKRAKRVVVGLNPMNMRWGPDRLRAFCRDVLEIEPDLTTAFLFANKSRNRLMLYSVDGPGDHIIIKQLAKGAFLLPVADDERRPYVVMKPAMIARLFRT